MNLPTEASLSHFPVGMEGGFAMRGGAALASQTWFVDYCEICDQRQIFLVGGLGLIACCSVCSDAPFTRMNAEEV